MPSPDLCRDLVSEKKADLVDLLHVSSQLLLCRPLSAALYCTLETIWFRNAFVRIIIVGKEPGDKSTITSLVSRREMCARRYLSAAIRLTLTSSPEAGTLYNVPKIVAAASRLW